MRCCIDDILLPLLLSHLPLLPFSPFPASLSWFSNHYCLHPTPPNHLNLPLHYPCYYRFLASIVHFAFFRHHSALCSIPACTIQLVLPKLLFFSHHFLYYSPASGFLSSLVPFSFLHFFCDGHRSCVAITRSVRYLPTCTSSAPFPVLSHIRAVWIGINSENYRMPLPISCIYIKPFIKPPLYL